ncbi:MAG: hypothetical protein DMG88_03190 [Acidobacteria bacterium]|nr:MAG: hypothetical protein DMG88_03190 [Acidobacteriota bacterium]
MAKQTPETLELADGTVSLYRNVMLMDGTPEFGVADRMIVQHLGNEQDVVVMADESGHRTVKRTVPQIQLQTSPVGTTSGSGYSLADLDAKTQERLLVIYKLFQKKKP